MANYYKPIVPGDPVTDTIVNGIFDSLDTQLTSISLVALALESQIESAKAGKTSLAEAIISAIGQSPPSSAIDTGTTGELRGDTNKLYVCVAPNTWKIITLENWS